MTSEDSKEHEPGTVEEEQYISTMLSTLSTNDLRSFKNYLDKNSNEIKDNISSIEYAYSVEPNIYTKDNKGKIAKVNPSNLFNSSYSSTFMRSFTSAYSQMINDKDAINNSYDILAGRLPEKYNEMMIVLSEPNTISDLLIYSLGFRDPEELSSIVSKIMNGEKVDINNEPLTLSYEDLMNKELKLIMPANTYKYNDKYSVYEDMTEDETYLDDLYNNAINLKIVGIVSPKEGVSSMILTPGVSYTSDLIDYIINYSETTDIVKKQLDNSEIDVFSGSRFDDKNNKFDLNFEDLVSIDSEKLQSAFNVKIDQSELQKQTQNYMTEIVNSVTTDISPAKKAFSDNLNTLANGMFNSIDGKFSIEDIDKIVEKYLSGNEASKMLSSLENNYVIPKSTFKTAYSGLLKSLLQIYINAYSAMSQFMPQNPDYSNSQAGGVKNETIGGQNELITQNSQIAGNSNQILNSSNQIVNSGNTKIQGNNLADMFNQLAGGNTNTQAPDIPSSGSGNNPATSPQELTAVVDKNIVSTVIKSFTGSTAIEETENTMARVMTEAVMKKTILTKVGELTSNLTNSFASAFNVDQDKISSAFQLKMTEEEITRIVTAMMSGTETTAKTNLISLGYQDKEEPTYISFYFNSFDGKENFMDYIDSYNQKMEELGEEDKVINYTDTTGILMGSVKTIVNAVTYVLIAFISISLVVSSIMIGIITYISVYERTKEIGILRAIGASKHNISSIFNAETFIIGLLSGLFGIGIAYSLIPIINSVLHHFTGNIPLNVTLYFSNALILVILSVILTLIGGLIPARAASKKDPVIALRTE